MRSGSKTAVFAAFLFLACGGSGERNNKIGRSGSVRIQPYCGNRDVRPEGIRLDVRLKKQECDNWCWAAAISMVSDYYGRPKRECSIASLRLDNLFQCCVDPICGTSPCNEPATREDFDKILAASGLHWSFYLRPLTEEELKLELSNGRPVIVGFNGIESSHVAVAVGFRPPEGSEISSVYFLIDPSVGHIDTDYEDLRNGPTSQEFMPWVMTWKNISTRTDGCNEQFDPLCGCETSP